jgi:hypothetical protein
MVGSQIASLTSEASFAHNLGWRCPNDQCKGILDIYTSRPFQWHQEYPNARCFGLCCRTLNIQESRKTPSPQLWEWEFHPPTSPKVGLRHFKHKCIPTSSPCPPPLLGPKFLLTPKWEFNFDLSLRKEIPFVPCHFYYCFLTMFIMLMMQSFGSL